MRTWLFNAGFFLLLMAACFTGSRCAAQAVPDTSLNNIIREDSINRATNNVPGKDTNLMKTREAVPLTSKVTAPESKAKPEPFQPNPKKAGMYSAILPGLGQLYDRQYWKVPVVYVGIGIAGYFFENNLTNYQNYRKAYIGRVNNPYPTDKYVGLYTEQQLQQLQDDYNRYLDLTVLIASIGYIAQIVDAIVYAHLKNFDMSRDISFRVRPVAMPNNGIGIGLVLTMKSKHSTSWP